MLPRVVTAAETLRVWFLPVGLQPTGATRGEAPGRRAHSPRRHLCHVCCRPPPPRIVNRQSA
jgi:hypothetical protein